MSKVPDVEERLEPASTVGALTTGKQSISLGLVHFELVMHIHNSMSIRGPAAKYG